MPKRFSEGNLKGKRVVNKELAKNKSQQPVWKWPAKAVKAWHDWTPEEYVLSWEVDRGEKVLEIQEKQYDELVAILTARNQKLALEQQQLAILEHPETREESNLLLSNCHWQET